MSTLLTHILIYAAWFVASALPAAAIFLAAPSSRVKRTDEHAEWLGLGATFTTRKD